MKKKIIFENKETNYSVDEFGNIYNDKFNRVMKGTTARNEYRSVQLSIDGKVKTLMVHRLVAEAFLPNPNNYPIVDHIDRNKMNNSVTNLRWVTVEINNNNKDRNKTKKKKEINHLEITKDFKEIPSCPSYYASKEGIILNSFGRILSGSERNGYLRVNFANGHHSIHRLIWETFNGEIPDGMVIDHIDGNRSNNALSNLRLVTQSENMNNAQRNGHKGQVKISQYDKEGNFIAKYNSIIEAAQAVNGSEVAIRSAADRHGSSAGYFWIRDDQDITIEEVLKTTPTNKAKFNATGVTQYDEQGNKIAHYNTLAEAAKAVNGSSSTIKRAADAERIGKGYYWILDSQNISISDLINK